MSHKVTKDDSRAFQDQCWCSEDDGAIGNYLQHDLQLQKILKPEYSSGICQILAFEDTPDKPRGDKR
jgi:hypothetical protein